MLRRLFLAAAIAAAAVAPTLALAQEISFEKAMAERVLGKADAPITIIEYASLTCPHCARFSKETLPKLKAAYVDTGKVKLIYRDFPFDGLALRAAALARCAPSERYFAVIDTLLTPQSLLAALQAIEQSFGRQRSYRHAPRTLDLDLLLHGEAVLASVTLTLPHPRLHQRAFVLQPLLELCPTLVAPVLGLLAAHLPATADQRLERIGKP